MKKEITKIAINTGGGDAPGLNAVIRAIVLSALHRGWECYGIRDSYNGLLVPEEYPEGGLIKLTREMVRGITHYDNSIRQTDFGGTLVAVNLGSHHSGPKLNPKFISQNNIGLLKGLCSAAYDMATRIRSCTSPTSITNGQSSAPRKKLKARRADQPVGMIKSSSPGQEK
jgi:hypothetical protein